MPTRNAALACSVPCRNEASQSCEPDEGGRCRDDPVLTVQVELLYAKVHGALVGSLVVALLLAAALWSYKPQGVLVAWLLSLLSVTVARWALWRHHRISPRAHTAPSWAVWFVAGTALNGVVWGTAAVVLFVPGQLPLQVMLAFAIGGLCTAASATASSHMPTLVSFLVPAALPVSVRFIAEPGPMYAGMGVMVATFLAVLLWVGRTGARNVVDNVRLRLDREALAQRLDAALCEREASNRQLQGQLAQSEQLARLGRLAAGVAHEINNPLAYVVHNLEYVASATADSSSSSELRDALNDARRGAERIRFIVRDLTALAPYNTEKQEAVHLESLLRSCMKFAGRDLEQRARLIFEPIATLHARGNPTRLSQVFLNLLTNALQSIAAGQPSANTIRVSMREAADGMVEVSVSDTGCGIPADQLDRIFDPFHTTKAIGENTGLGLSLARTIVAGLGGTIQVSSVVGEGTTFTVRLPAANCEDALSRNDVAAIDARDSGRPVSVQRRILIVDDDRLVARSLKRALRPHRVAMAIGGRAALRWLCSEPEVFDAVVCDVLMPDLDGVEVFRIVRETRPTLAERFIFVTGAATPQTEAFLEGINNPRVHKPVDPRELLRLVERTAPRDTRHPSLSVCVSSPPVSAPGRRARGAVTAPR